MLTVDGTLVDHNEATSCCSANDSDGSDRATWQRSKVHFLRNVAAAVPKLHAPAVLALVKSIFLPLGLASRLGDTSQP